MDGRRPKNGVRSACRLGGRAIVPGKYDLLVRACVKWGGREKGTLCHGGFGRFSSFLGTPYFWVDLPSLVSLTDGGGLGGRLGGWMDGSV